jgi:hypothetical protein
VKRYALQRKEKGEWKTVFNFDAQPCSQEDLSAWLNTGMKVDWRVIKIGE